MNRLLVHTLGVFVLLIALLVLTWFWLKSPVATTGDWLALTAVSLVLAALVAAIGYLAFSPSWLRLILGTLLVIALTLVLVLQTDMPSPGRWLITILGVWLIAVAWTDANPGLYLAGWRFWAAFLAFLLLGLYLPIRLLWWIPTVDGLRTQMLSALLRAGTGAFLFSATLIALGGSRRVTS